MRLTRLENDLKAAYARRRELSAKAGCMDFREIGELQALNIHLPDMERELSSARFEAKARKAKFGMINQSGAETIWMKNNSGGLLTAPRMIHGIASTSTINSHKYALLSRGATAKLPVPILSQHECHAAPIGQVVLLRKREREIYVIGTIWQNEAADYAWSLIKAGSLRALSGAAEQGSMRVQGVVDGVTFYDRWTLKEVSVCRDGANPDCHFQIYKS